MGDWVRVSDSEKPASPLRLLALIIGLLIRGCMPLALSGCLLVRWHQDPVDCPQIAVWQLAWVNARAVEPARDAWIGNDPATGCESSGEHAIVVAGPVHPGRYRFWLRAVTAWGATSDWSDPIEAVTEATR